MRAKATGDDSEVSHAREENGEKSDPRVRFLVKECVVGSEKAVVHVKQRGNQAPASCSWYYILEVVSSFRLLDRFSPRFSSQASTPWQISPGRYALVQAW